MHYGFLSSCTFTKVGKKITLAPFSPSQLAKSKPQQNYDQTKMLRTLGQPFLKAKQYEFKALREWLLFSLEKAKPPSLEFTL